MLISKYQLALFVAVILVVLLTVVFVFGGLPSLFSRDALLYVPILLVAICMGSCLLAGLMAALAVLYFIASKINPLYDWMLEYSNGSHGLRETGAAGIWLVMTVVSYGAFKLYVLFNPFRH